jgi:hypothetical protein
MLATKPEVEAQIKELNDLHKSTLAEVKSLQAQIKHAHASSAHSDVSKAVGVLADAMLVNTLQTKFGKEVLPADQASALRGALEVFSAIQNAEDVLPYARMREGFVQLFQAFV